MIRFPIGSIPPSGDRKRMRPPPTNVFGTIAVSTTLVQTLGGLSHFIIRESLHDAIHSRGILSGSGSEIFQLHHDVGGAVSRKIGGFRMTRSRHEMARTARESISMAKLDDLGRRCMFLREPV